MSGLVAEAVVLSAAAPAAGDAPFSAETPETRAAAPSAA